MADSPEVKVRLTAEDQGLTAAIGQLRNELGKLQSEQVKTAGTSQKVSGAFKSITEQALSAVKLRLANIPGLGNFGSLLAIRAYEPVGKMLEESAGGLEEKFGGAAVAIGGTAAALVGIGAIALEVTHHMMELAQSIENTAAATGLTTTQVQVYKELAKEMDLDAEGLETSFARIQTQLGEFVSTGKAAGEGSQYFVRVMKQLGVAIEDSSGRIRPAQDVLSDFYDALNKIPDVSTRTALELAALGTRGRVIAQMFDEARRQGISFRDLLQKIQDTGPVLTEGQLANLEDAKGKWDAVTRSVGGYMRQLGELIAFGTTHPIKAFLALSGGGPAGVADLLSQSMIPPAGAGKGGGNPEQTAALMQVIQQNQLLEERRDILRAGGKDQQALQQAEIGYAAALKSHNVELIKAYSEQISELRSIISLTAAKKEKAPPLEDAAAKAQLALSLKLQQDELTVWKAGAAQREEVDKEEYEKGTLSLRAYFDARRTEIEQETAKEIAVMKQERDQVQAAADLAGQQSAAKKTAAGKAATPEAKQTLLGQADRLAAEQLTQLARVDELSTQISAKQIESQTKITALDAEQFKSDAENKQKIIQFLKEIDELQHKTVESSKEEIQAKTAEMRVVLEQAGESTKQINELLAKYTQLKTSAAQFEAQEKTNEEGLLAVENQRRSIELQIKDGTLSEQQGKKKLTELLKQQIPLLAKQAQIELALAQGSGDQERIAQAQQLIQKIQQLGDQLQKVSQITKQQIAGDMSKAFDQFFESIPKGTRGIIQAFGQMEQSVIKSLENVAAQMLANLLVGEALTEGTKLNDAKTAAANVYASVSAIPYVGWILAPPAAAAAFAAVLAFEKGGIVPGSGRGDTVPAMLAPREMVLPADISTGLRGAIATGSIARPSDLRTPSFSAPELAAGAGHVDNRTYSPQITVHQTNSKMSVDEISAAVRRGMRLGY